MTKLNRIIPTLISITFLLTIFSCKDVEEVGGCQFLETLDGYELVWSDEFDGSSIDASKWGYDLGDGCQLGPNLCGWGNNELQYYTERPENARIEDGKLVIESRKESPLYLGEHEYTSARMVTKGKADFKYARIDVRAKLPIGQGLWPAAWMLPTDTTYGIWPKSGEIDIMEYLGNEPSRVFGTIHYGNNGWRFDSQYYDLEQGSFHEDFHVFTVLWNENCIQFQVDGINIGTPHSRSTVLPSTYPFDQPFHMILNIAVGGNLPGNPTPATQFPQRMEVDYVRVYQEAS